MFERFTDRARRVLVLAQEEAAGLNHNFIGTEHILLGLVHEGEGVGAKALERLGVDLDVLRETVKGLVGPVGATAPSRKAPFTPRAKTVLEMSLREALQLGHNYIGTEHLLLGLGREGEGVAAQALIQLGVDLGAIRKTVVEILSGYGTIPRSSHLPERGAAALQVLARKVAQDQPIKTGDYLLALIDEADGVAAKALAALGVTREAAEAAIAAVDITTTSDAPPKEPIEFELGQGVKVQISDPAVIEQIQGIDPIDALRIVLEYFSQEKPPA